MTDEEMETQEWDLESAEMQPPVRGRRAIVSVGFKPDELSLVAKCARGSRMKLSEFVRNAAIEKAEGKVISGEVQLTGTAAQGQATFLFQTMILSTQASWPSSLPDNQLVNTV
jgi:hypothetical protein